VGAQTTSPAAPKDAEGEAIKALAAQIVSLKEGGKQPEASAALTAAGAKATTVQHLRDLEKAAKAVMGDKADAYLAGLVAGKCKASLASASFETADWAAGLLISQGNKADAKVAIAAMAKEAWKKDTAPAQEMAQTYKQAKAAVPEAELVKWFIDLCLGLCDTEGFSRAVAEAYMAILVDQKTDDARRFLDEAGKRVKTIDHLRWVEKSAREAFGDRVGNWMLAHLLNEAKQDIEKPSNFYSATWAVKILMAYDEKEKARKLVEASAPVVKTVKEWNSLRGMAMQAMGKLEADAWLAGIFTQNCMGDLQTCAIADAAKAAGYMSDAGKKDEAKGVLEKLAARTTTVEDCQRLGAVAPRMLGAKPANEWLAGILLNRCKADFDKCPTAAGNWAVRTLKSAGKTKESAALQESLAKRPPTPSKTPPPTTAESDPNAA
jgi:hypothetical protein